MGCGECRAEGADLVQGSCRGISEVTLHPGQEEAVIGRGKMEREVFWADGTAWAKALRWEEAR